MYRTRITPALAVLLVAATGCDAGPVEPPVSVQDVARHGPFGFGDWGAAVNVQTLPGTHVDFNTTSLDGCPFTSRDGRIFFMASSRPGSRGLDIWMARREHPDDPWGEPVNVGDPINTEFNDFCPTLAQDGHTFLFASNRPGCGGADLYISRMRKNGTFETPTNLGCTVNSGADEHSPFPLLQPGTRPVLYFSSFRPGGFAPDPDGAESGDSDIYVSEFRGGKLGAPTLVPGVNSAAPDGHPNVRHDGLEIFFFSARPGAQGPDIYSATRRRTKDAWSTPVNLGELVNSAGGETRPSLSWDGTTLYFGSGRLEGEGDADIYVTTRPVVKDVGRGMAKRWKR